MATHFLIRPSLSLVSLYRTALSRSPTNIPAPLPPCTSVCCGSGISHSRSIPGVGCSTPFSCALAPPKLRIVIVRIGQHFEMLYPTCFPFGSLMTTFELHVRLNGWGVFITLSLSSTTCGHAFVICTLWIYNKQ